MKVEKNVKSACEITLNVSADAEEIKAGYNKIVNMFVRNGVISGFRKGKAPLALVKKEFSSQIADEARQSLVREFYNKAIEQEKISPIAISNLENVSLAPETGISFVATVEVVPEFKLPKYTKLSLKRKEVEVTDAQVDERIANYRLAFAKYDDAAADTVADDGDFVQIDFKGTIDGKPVAELAPDAKAVSEGTGFWTQVDGERFIPEVVAAIKGMKLNETKAGIKVTFPKDVGPEAIRGKKAVYDVLLKALRHRSLPDDKAFLEAAKVESMDALKKDFRAEMEKAAKTAADNDMRQQAIDKLLKDADFEVPASVVARQVQNNLQELASNARRNGMTPEFIDQNRDKIIAETEDRSKKQVRLTYILSAIAKAEKFEIGDDEMMASLAKVAASMEEQTKPEDLLENLKQNGRIEMYKEQLKAEKALNFVVENAK